MIHCFVKGEYVWSYNVIFKATTDDGRNGVLNIPVYKEPAIRPTVMNGPVKPDQGLEVVRVHLTTRVEAGRQVTRMDFGSRSDIRKAWHFLNRIHTYEN